jgi:hypothetical protein
MKPTITIIGTIVATIGLCPGIALAENPPPAQGSALPSSTFSQPITKTDLEGHIMPLRDYLSGSSSWSSAASLSTSSSSDRYQPKKDQQKQDQQSLQSPSKPTDPADLNRGADPSDPNRAQSATPPGQATTVTPTPTPTPSAGVGRYEAAARADQPLVFVTRSSTAGSASDRQYNPTQPAGPTSPLASSAGEEVYIVLFNPADVASRSAFSKANSITSEKSSSSASAPITEPPVTSLPRKTEADRDLVDRSRSAAIEPREGDTSLALGKIEKCHVKISGVVLSRGNLRAIEISRVEQVNMASSDTSARLPK